MSPDARTAHGKAAKAAKTVKAGGHRRPVDFRDRFRAEETDWPQIALLYGERGFFLASPIVALNRAVAVAMADGLEAGLRLLDDIAQERALAGYHLYHAARADLLRRSGRHAEASTFYRRALDLCQNAVEQRFLARRLAETTISAAER